MKAPARQPVCTPDRWYPPAGHWGENVNEEVMKSIHEKMMPLILLMLLLTVASQAHAAGGTDVDDDSGLPSDSLLAIDLRREGEVFTAGNNVTLLMTGQQKFDDLFAAIGKPAILSILNTSISGMTPSPCSCLISLPPRPQRVSR